LSVDLVDRDGFHDRIWENNMLITPFVERTRRGSVLHRSTISVDSIDERTKAGAKALLISKGFLEEGFSLSYS